ncbi:MAG: adenylate/guanylate cyclase domain-containing protein [Planctomycetaceae bacterium]|nr:adenylate/guanylate cyclase domain-containing protein [Planctomycetaceae bacterium]
MELIAEGLEPQQRLRFTLEATSTYVLGRGIDADVRIPWDRQISRRHAELSPEGDRLTVRRLKHAANPVFHEGRVVENCLLRRGEHFVAGSTRFVVEDADSSAAPPPAARPFEEVTFSREALQQVRFRDPDRRIEVLSHLPEVIWGARSDTELHMRLVNLLLAGISQADAAGIVLIEPSGEMRVLQWDRRRETAGAFQPSARLVVEAVARRRQSLLHVWESADQPAEFTATQEFDWAFCTPVPGAPTERWGLYLGGRFDREATGPSRGSGLDRESNLQADVKFAELVAEIVGSVRKLNHLERQQAGLRQFLPPAILAVIGDNSDPTLLAPRESQVSVMFCDLRGFSRQAENAQGDLAGLLDRVSQALGVMTRHISQHGGVIGDFQGDAAMGFWGWPVAHEDDALEACRAALAIRAEFAAAARTPGNPLADFRVGLGLARGKAVAGRIGTGEHFVFTAFGPVVNLASRLEGMTKQLRVPILIDEVLAEIVRTRMPADQGRTRHLARVLPYGLETPLVVSELLPSTAELPELTAEHLAAYDAAVEHFTAGRWDDAYAALRTLPPGDRAQDFLALHIAQQNRVAPTDWTGVIKLPSK